MSPRTTARPYRDFLTPALHRRFTSAFLLTTCLCYVEAVWMGEWNNFFWPWFPLGFAGVRTGLLCIASMVVYVLRVSQMHIGERTTNYSFETFFKYLFRLNTVLTLFWYTVSSWLFVETYIWSQASYAKLGFTDSGRTHERIRLNERPMFLRFMFLCLAVTQSAIHLYKDYDRVAFPVSKVQKKPNSTTEGSVIAPRNQIWAKLKQLVPTSLIIMLSVLVGGNLLYFTFLRQAIWEWNYRFGRWIFSLAKTSRPGANPALAELWARFIVEGFLLALLWQFTNTAFDAYFTQEPLKKGKPITDDSKDPNGSLLNGLKAKKEVPRNVAFWELVLITERFDARRRSIYEEIDRNNGSTWKQILVVCLAEIRGISERIRAAQSPGSSAPTKPEPIQILPRISQPLNEDGVIGKIAPPTTRLDRLGNFATDFAKTHASPPGSSPPTQKLLEYSNTLLNSEKTAQLNSSTVTSWLQTRLLLLVRSPFGIPFRKSLRRTANVIIAGTPYSRAGTISDAVSALTGLAMCSFKEDILGQVHKDVPEIIRAFVAAIKNIEGFVKGMEVHWTDVDLEGKNENEIKRIPEVEELLRALKGGLEKIVLAFVEYLEPMGMTEAEITEAKDLAQKDRKPAGKEMTGNK
ncbi:hypothetical protein AOQ84DRAFT_304447 [Glonium stellatum]|uniref:Nuclear envelope protein n=1 Tax=Glonium stellatum TaxID=574774 RepID=A0A8E2EQP5_9PEZI|nr:hypothetical protein AOQ84DRAFT_304447 [Glonium stellatum]